MSTYKNFAVIGAGEIGTPITKNLVSEGANVTVITRTNSTSSTKDLPPGVKVAKVDLTDVPALAAALAENNIEVVISTVGYGGIPHQTALGDAAKLAGVKLFVPSEFGYPTTGLGEADGHLGLKALFADHLKEIGLPSLRIFNGGFATFIPWITGSGSGKVQILGKGDQKATFTDPADIAGFTAYVLTHLPPSELANKIFRIEGERASLLDIAGYYGSKVTVEHVEAFPGEEFKFALQSLISSGHGSVGYDSVSGKELTGADAAGASNALWPGHHWKGIKEALGL